MEGVKQFDGVTSPEASLRRKYTEFAPKKAPVLTNQIVAYELGQLHPQCLLHRQPILRVHVFLMIGVDFQEKKFPDEVGLREALALRVETLEHEVGIVIRAERDTHHRQAFDDNSL